MGKDERLGRDGRSGMHKTRLHSTGEDATRARARQLDAERRGDKKRAEKEKRKASRILKEYTRQGGKVGNILQTVRERRR